MRRPVGISIAQLKNNTFEYVDTLEREKAIGLAEYLDYQYHSLNKSLVSDEVYDILKDSIATRWPRSAYLKKVGHTPSKRTDTVKLPVYMPSMDKLKPDSKNLPQFVQESKLVVVSDKLDGISLLLEYSGGKLVRCYTRGDGKEGQDVSGIIPALKAPKTISVKTPMFVRCEFIVKKTTFDSKFSKSSGGDYQTGRNMGGGLLTHNQPDARVKAFDVVAYEISKGSLAGSPIKKQLDALKRMRFNVVRHIIIQSPTPQKIEEVYNKFRASAEYEIDGIIVDHNTTYSVTASNPKHAKAFKINSLENSKVITVKEVEFNRSRLDRLVPRVIVDPVSLGGVTVTYFTGHSYFYIQHGYTYSEYKAAQKTGKTLRVLPINKGAKIRVIRSGDVIPYIMEVVKPSRKAAVPSVPYKLGPNNVHAIAVEDQSEDDEKKRITHFFSSLDVDGLKYGLVSKLYDAGFTTVQDILFAEVDELLEVDGIQIRTANNIVKNIDLAIEKATFSTLGYASQQFDESIGSRRLQSIVDTYPDFVEKARRKTVPQLTLMIERVPGIKTQAGLIAAGMKRFLQWMEETGLDLSPEEVQKPESNKLGGLRVLFTGIRDAALLESIIANGGKAASTVKSADVLIIKPGKPNNKTMYAEDNGIPMFSVEEFKRKYKV